MANVIRFAIKTFQARIFEKLEVTFLADFFHKQLSFLNGSNIKLGFLLILCFASFDSFKAVTGCLEKLEILAK